MPSVTYGSKTIQYSILVKPGLKSHYITVEKHAGVVLKGASLPTHTTDQLILKKARWILEKLEVVKAIEEDTIVTGSRIPYLGRTYYTEVIINKLVNAILIEFNHSKFKITLNNKLVTQAAIRIALEAFYKVKAIEKIIPRVTRLSESTHLPVNQVQVRKMNKRWGSCTPGNKIIINMDAIKLPFTLIDYLVVHELCHTKVKDHTKAFWALLSTHVPNWRLLDERIKEFKL